MRGLRFLEFYVDALKLFLGGRERPQRKGDARLRVIELALDRADLPAEIRRLESPEFRRDFLAPLPFHRLALQKPQMRRDLLDRRGNLLRVLRRVLQLAFRVALFELVFAKSQDLLDHLAALLGRCLDEKIALPLPDDDEAFGAKP